MSLAMGGREAVTAVSVAMRKSRCPLTQLPLVTASRPVGIEHGVGDVYGRTGIWGYYRSGRQLAETIA